MTKEIKVKGLSKIELKAAKSLIQFAQKKDSLFNSEYNYYYHANLAVSLIDRYLAMGADSEGGFQMKLERDVQDWRVDGYKQLCNGLTANAAHKFGDSSAFCYSDTFGLDKLSVTVDGMNKFVVYVLKKALDYVRPHLIPSYDEMAHPSKYRVTHKRLIDKVLAEVEMEKLIDSYVVNAEAQDVTIDGEIENAKKATTAENDAEEIGGTEYDEVDYNFDVEEDDDELEDEPEIETSVADVEENEVRKIEVKLQNGEIRHMATMDLAVHGGAIVDAGNVIGEYATEDEAGLVVDKLVMAYECGYRTFEMPIKIADENSTPIETPDTVSEETAVQTFVPVYEFEIGKTYFDSCDRHYHKVVKRTYNRVTFVDENKKYRTFKIKMETYDTKEGKIVLESLENGTLSAQKLVDTTEPTAEDEYSVTEPTIAQTAMEVNDAQEEKVISTSELEEKLAELQEEIAYSAEVSAEYQQKIKRAQEAIKYYYAKIAESEDKIWKLGLKARTCEKEKAELEAQAAKINAEILNRNISMDALNLAVKTAVKVPEQASVTFDLQTFNNAVMIANSPATIDTAIADTELPPVNTEINFDALVTELIDAKDNNAAELARKNLSGALDTYIKEKFGGLTLATPIQQKNIGNDVLHINENYFTYVNLNGINVSVVTPFKGVQFNVKLTCKVKGKIQTPVIAIYHDFAEFKAAIDGYANCKGAVYQFPDDTSVDFDNQTWKAVHETANLNRQITEIEKQIESLQEHLHQNAVRLQIIDGQTISRTNQLDQWAREILDSDECFNIKISLADGKDYKLFDFQECMGIWTTPEGKLELKAWHANYLIATYDSASDFKFDIYRLKAAIARGDETFTFGK